MGACCLCLLRRVSYAPCITAQDKPARPMPKPLGKAQDVSSLLIQQCSQIIKYFKNLNLPLGIRLMWEKSSFLWLSIFLYQHIKLFTEAQEHLKAPKGHLPTSSSEAARIQLLAWNTLCWFRLFSRLLSCRHDHRSPQSVTDQVQKTDSPL